MATSPDDLSTLAKALAAVATGFAAFVALGKGLAGWSASKATKEQVQRHKEANDEQTKRLHAAVLDLYAKHEDVRDKLEDISKISTDRHLETIHAINQLAQRINR